MERSSRAHDRGQAAEIARIETAYKLRDASSSATYSFANPGYAFYLQALEWSLLETLRRAVYPERSDPCPLPRAAFAEAPVPFAGGRGNRENGVGRTPRSSPPTARVCLSLP